jgi:hypothetical protein
LIQVIKRRAKHEPEALDLLALGGGYSRFS